MLEATEGANARSISSDVRFGKGAEKNEKHKCLIILEALGTSEKRACQNSVACKNTGIQYEILK